MDLREIDFDNRSIQGWNGSKDANIVNNFCLTLQKIDIWPLNRQEAVEGTWYEKFYMSRGRCEEILGNERVHRHSLPDVSGHYHPPK